MSDVVAEPPTSEAASTDASDTGLHGADDAEHSHHPNYFVIFAALCVLTAVSWLLDESVGWGMIKSHVLLSALVLAVATAKALFVAVYFMHLKFEGRWKYVLLTPTLVLAIGLPLALAPDLSFQYYPADTEQTRHLDTLGEATASGAPYGEGVDDERADASAKQTGSGE